MSVQSCPIIGDAKMLYQQLPLNTMEIRLLRLDLTANPASAIRCTLRKHNLFERPDFEALTYTWGESSPSRNIIVNGFSFRVTINLYHFLKRQQEAGRDCNMWVDAICVNQSDLLEKNLQIPNMNMVYMAATTLTIWLGDESSDSKLALERIRGLGSGSPYAKMPHLEDHVKRAIQSVLQRPWWKRIWIVQELSIGGAGSKLELVWVQCGQDRVPWMNFVVAAARIKAYHDDQRQGFPDIGEILELDSLREHAGIFIYHGPTKGEMLELLCRYRHFLASNKRDKIYAIWNMFVRKPSERLQTRYDESVENVYLELAANFLSPGDNLEILRQCGPRSIGIPSWAPDWSVALSTPALPLRNIRRYFDVPWWAEPEFLEPRAPMGANLEIPLSRVRFKLPQRSPDPEEDERLRKLRLRHLEMSAKGGGVVDHLEEIPPNFGFHEIPPEIKADIQELMRSDRLIVAVADKYPGLPENPDAMQQGELVNERQMKQWLVRELQHSTSEPLYRASGSNGPCITLNKMEKHLQIKGILWDQIDTCHESFVENVDEDWANTTHFMVAVGCCKHLAVTNKPTRDLYSTSDGLLEAFWSTLVVGQPIEAQLGENGPVRYADWLPELPASWLPSRPLTTAKTAGLVSLAEYYEAFNDFISACNESPEFASSPLKSCPDPRMYELAFPAYNQENDTRLCELAATWHKQPYDLYHRPFSFLNIVPDPYWDIRRQEDNLAKAQRASRIGKGGEWCSSSLDVPNDMKPFISHPRLHDEMNSAIDAAYASKPSLIPQNTLNAGVEKFALGRKFFITNKGYLGLGPKTAEPGDRIAIIYGSGVPFILRKSAAKLGRPTWEIIGECYVHGIMDGEVIRKYELGLAESQMIVLS